MEKVYFYCDWCDSNWAATACEKVPGAIVLTGDTMEELRCECKSTLDDHLDLMKEDGDEMPQWLADGEYEIEILYGTEGAKRRLEEEGYQDADGRVRYSEEVRKMMEE